jgi:3-hydroxybutyrate dehydrogenase
VSFGRRLQERDVPSGRASSDAVDLHGLLEHFPPKWTRFGDKECALGFLNPINLKLKLIADAHPTRGRIGRLRGALAMLDGRHALVTGGGRGIGRAVAATLRRSGAVVTVIGRNRDKLADAVARGAANAYQLADVTDEAALGAAVERSVAAFGPIDILVANAGGGESSPFLKAEASQFRRMFDLNVLGVVHATRAVLGDMMRRRFGRVVAIASTAGLKGYPYVSAYCAAKHAVVGLVRAVALEAASTGVTVNAVCPGYTDTDMVADSIARIARKTGRSDQDALAGMLRTNPLGRLIAPEEVAATVLFLCSVEAAAITGTTIAVAGGEV